MPLIWTWADIGAGFGRLPHTARDTFPLILRRAVAMGKDYLGVFKASYDYVSQSDDEVSIKEDQILFLVERVDEE